MTRVFLFINFHDWLILFYLIFMMLKAPDGKEIEDESVAITLKYPSLVKYEIPLLVSVIDKTPKKKSKPSEGYQIVASENIDQVMNKILPPRCWTESGLIWQQCVSCKPATNDDVKHLQEVLDIRLHLTQARTTGICPIRREIFRQCFDEIIRQQTISCSERGLLLLRLRNEFLETLEAYEKVYVSTIGYGLRRALQAFQHKELLREQIKKLEKEKKRVGKMIREIKQRNKETEENIAETRTIIEHKYALEIAYVTKTNNQLKTQITSSLFVKY